MSNKNEPLRRSAMQASRYSRSGYRGVFVGRGAVPTEPVHLWAIFIAELENTSKGLALLRALAAHTGRTHLNWRRFIPASRLAGYSRRPTNKNVILERRKCMK